MSGQWWYVNRDVQAGSTTRHVTVRTFSSMEAAIAYMDELNEQTSGKANATYSDHRVNVPAG